MPEQADLIVVGAGPAGLAAARAAGEAGLEVAVIDDQPGPGGQIYRAVAGAGESRLAMLGADYARGRSLLDALDQPAVRHIPNATVWQVTREREVYLSEGGAARHLRARHIVLATGAMERPMPFPGWTRPGVMTAGAGQILLKTAGLVPGGRTILAGSGPLLFLLAWQYLRAGASIAALVETTPRANTTAALPHLPGALRATEYLRKGLSMLTAIRRAGIPYYRRARGLNARGQDGGEGEVTSLGFTAGGRTHELACDLLLVHQGVVPNVQITRALDLAHDWDPLQRCWRPRLDSRGETELEGIAVAGDGGGIGGARVAELQGRLAGLHAAARLGALSDAELAARAKPLRRELAHHLAVRPFLDALYAPAAEFLAPGDETMVCRCEEVTAGAVRGYVRLGCLGPNQTKAFGRPGMGPCQGRFCGLTVSEIIARERAVSVPEVGYYRIRPPIKPVSLGELAAMEEVDDHPELEAKAV